MTTATSIFILWIIGAYLVGSIPFGLITGLLFFKKDLRKFGSGNIGMTNAVRLLGWPAGIVVFALDFAKGFFPVYFYKHTLAIHTSIGTQGAESLFLQGVVVTTVLGAIFSPYVGFRGGRGVATSLGAFVPILGTLISVPLVVFILFLILFRWVGIASIIASLTIVIIAVAGFDHWWQSAAPFVVFALILYSHRKHISDLRLLRKNP